MDNNYDNCDNNDDKLLKYKNITKNIDTIIGTKYILDILDKRNIKIYWGTTPSCLPNINYIIPLLKIKNFINNNCEITILLADIHAYLDSKKSNYEILSIRTDIHQKIIKMLLKYLDINTDKIKFVQGSSYQLNQEFTMDVYKFNSLCSVSKVKKAGEKAVIQSYDPLMTSLLYPTLQALDIEYLECDVYFGDIYQKEICLLANDIMEQLEYTKKGFFLHLLTFKTPILEIIFKFLFFAIYFFYIFYFSIIRTFKNIFIIFFWYIFYNFLYIVF